MKNFIKVLLIALFSFVYVESYAQKFILKGGLNLSNMLVKIDAYTFSDDYKNRAGFHLGATVEIPISDVFSVESGLLFMTRGYSIEFEGNLITYGLNKNLNYLDVPIIFKASYSLSKNTKMYGAIGPYLGFGLSGKHKLSQDDGYTSVEEVRDISWGNNENEDELKRLDFGLSFGAGVEVSTILIGVSYDLGVANISPLEDGGTKKNRVLKFSIGYIISK